MLRLESAQCAETIRTLKSIVMRLKSDVTIKLLKSWQSTIIISISNAAMPSSTISLQSASNAHAIPSRKTFPFAAVYELGYISTNRPPLRQHLPFAWYMEGGDCATPQDPHRHDTQLIPSNHSWSFYVLSSNMHSLGFCRSWQYGFIVMMFLMTCEILHW